MSAVATRVTDGLPEPFDYQTQLFEIAIKRNTIICLPTGSGKTYIAVKLIQHYQHELLDDFDDDNAKRTIFLVPTKPLVAQQASYIEKFTDLEVGRYTGQSMINNKQIDFWSQNEWNDQFKKYKVLVMVHQLFLNLIDSHKFLSLNKVNLIIFDEAHHAGPNKKLKKVNHPYSQITDAIKRSSYRPHILALSASLIKNNVECRKIRQVVQMLEESLNSTCATITGPENLGHHGTHPKELFWEFNSGSLVSIVALENILSTVIQFLNQLLSSKTENCANKEAEIDVDNSDESMDDGLIIGDIFGSSLPIRLRELYRSLLWIKSALIEMGPWCVQSSLHSYIKYVKKICELHKYSFPAFVKFLEVFMELYTRCDTILDQVMKNMTEKQKLFDCVSPKMQRLLELLSNYKPNIIKLCGLVFVDRRNECTEISRWLNAVAKYDEEKYGFLKVGYAVGISGLPGFVSSFTKQDLKKQEEVLRQFSDPQNPEKNLLIATSVLEEGIDVPHCNLVVRYNPPKTFRDYVQSKGRARKDDARYVLFCDTSDTQMKQHIEYFSEVDRVLQEICEQREQNRDIGDHETDHENDVVSRIGARITLNTSINAVHTYCAKLPSDSFTILRPVDVCESKGVQYKFYRYIVTMPINSDVPKVVGSWSQSQMKAKKLAYREVCRQLYAKGKLNDHLLPVKREVVVKSYYEELGLIGNGDEEVIKGEDGKTIKPGTRKRKRSYTKQIHESLRLVDSSQSNNHLCLYCVEMTPESTDSETELKVGFASFSKLPIEETCVSSFPVFNRYGKIEVAVKLMNEKLTLSREKMNLLKSFHAFIFGQALSKSKDKLTIDVNSCESGIFVVLLKDGVIDWNELERIVLKFKQYNSFEVTLEGEIKIRKAFKYVPKEYVNSVVVPWYRDDDRTVYYKVRNSDPKLNPSSPFPKEEYGTYRNYFFKKYNVKVLVEEQLLLAVDGFARSFARISPITKKTKIGRPIHLIPELCLILPIKSTVFDLFLPLPAIFYRLNQLFVAEQFRRYVDIKAFGESLPQQRSSQRFNNKCDRLNAKCNDVYEEMDVDEIERDLDMDEELYGSDDEGGWWLAEEDNDQMNDNVCDWDMVCDEEIVEISETNDSYEMHESLPINGAVRNPETLARQQILVKGVNDRNLEFNTERLEPVGNREFVRVFQDELSNGNFDWQSFVSKIIDSLRRTYDDILNEFVPRSQWASEDENNDQSKEMEVAPKNLNMEVMERVKSFDNYREVRQGPNANLILQALTSRRSMDVFNFERLEMIGDSFLKFATSLFMFCKYPQLDVGVLVLLKDKQVSNFNLYRLGKQHEIANKMMFYAFDSTSRLSSVFGEEQKQEIDDKSIADCVEALIGAYLLCLGPQGAIMFMKWLGLNVTNVDGISIRDNHWMNFSSSAISQFADEDSEREIMNKVEELYKRGRMHKFEEILGYKFSDRSHLVKALTHSSYYHNTVTGCYQRYEFLGDAVIDYLITRHIFEDEQEFNPGELTDLRQSLVHNAFFGCLAVKYKFHKYLKHLSPDIFAEINKFETKFSENGPEDQTYGSFLLVTEDDTKQNEEVEIPKILGDIFESVAAAIYLDSGLSLDAVWNVYYKFFESSLIRNSQHIPKAPTRQLFESDEKTKFGREAEVNEDKVVSVKLKTHGHVFEGFGKNKKYAKLDAAKKAVKALKKLNKLKIRTKPRAVAI